MSATLEKPSSLSQDMLDMLKDTVRRYAQEKIKPRAEEIDALGFIPKDIWLELGNLGLLGVTVAEAYGGANMGYLAHIIAMEEISRASGSLGLSYVAHSNLCVNQLQLNGSEAQKHQYLPKLISGEHLGALAMSEPGAGSDVVGMSMRAEKQGKNYVLNGSKLWITNGPEADIVIVYAKTKPEALSKGITSFIVETNTAGFSTAQKLDKFGMRGSSTGELVFENCVVPEENILGELDAGVKVLMSGLDYERVILAAGSVGIMQACMDTVMPYIHERKQFGKAIGEFQLMQGKIADMYTRLSAARAYLYAVGRDCDERRVQRKDAASCFLFASEAGVQTALDAMQCLGGNGYINEYPTGRFLRDAKLYDIGGGTIEVRRMLIGRELFNETT